MKRLLRIAVRLYPSWWRQRYALEFEALLEDLNPGWRGFLDVINGALTMQIRTLRTIPVVCALAGAVGGGIIALRTPDVFASSATIRLKEAGSANAGGAVAQELPVVLKRALDASKGAAVATTVTMSRWESAQATLKLTYQDRDPAQAQRVAASLTAAIASESNDWAVATKVLDAPDLPTSPIRPDYPMNVASGGGVGLMAGGAVFLLLRFRRRPASAG